MVSAAKLHRSFGRLSRPKRSAIHPNSGGVGDPDPNRMTKPQHRRTIQQARGFAKSRDLAYRSDLSVARMNISHRLRAASERLMNLIEAPEFRETFNA